RPAASPAASRFLPKIRCLGPRSAELERAAADVAVLESGEHGARGSRVATRRPSSNQEGQVVFRRRVSQLDAGRPIPIIDQGVVVASGQHLSYPSVELLGPAFRWSSLAEVEA